MNLGIERSVLGDILVKGWKAGIYFLSGEYRCIYYGATDKDKTYERENLSRGG